VTRILQCRFNGFTLLQLGSATATSGTPGDLAIALGMNGAASATTANHSIAIAVGTGSTASAGFTGSHDLATVNGNMLTATATGGNHLTDIVTPSGTL
jgi:hypothetical protein